MGKSSIYLGNSLVMGMNANKEFSLLKKRVGRRLEVWNRQLLSKAGKATLLKYVVQAIPTYTMSTFQLPLG